MATEAGPGRPFVGRGEVVEALRHRLEDLRAGAGEVTLLVGEAGVGKSALIAQLVGEVRATGVGVLSGRAPPLDDPPPFSLLRSAIESARESSSRATPGDAPMAGDEDLIGLVPRLGGEALPDLVSIEQRLLEQLGQADDRGERARDRVLELLAERLVELTHRGPLVLVLEDVHRADDRSLGALALLADRLHHEPFWLLATSRPAASLSTAGRDRLERFEQTTRAHPVELRPLTREEVAEYLRVSDPSRVYSPTEVADRFARSGGIPLLLDQLDRRTLPSGPVPSAIPPFAPDEQRALEVAAVLGPEFSFEVLRRVSGEPDERRFAEVVGRLVGAGLLVERAAETLAFPGDRLREEVYGRLTERRREVLHWSAGETLEATGRAGVSTVFALARHFYLGHASRKSVKYNRLAAEVADRALAPEAARDHLRRAVESQREVKPPQVEEEAELVLEVARVTEELGQLADSERTIREFLEREQNDPRLSSRRRASLEIFLSKVLTDKGDLPAATELAQKVLVAPGLDPWPILRVGAHHQIGMSLYYEGKYAEALVHHTEELGLARQVGNALVTLRAQIWRLAALAMMGPTDEVVAEARAVTVERDRLGSLRESAQAHLFLGDMLADGRCPPAQRREAIAEYARAIQFADQAHDPRRVGWARYKTGELLRETRRFDEALQNLRAAHDILSEVGDRVGLSMATKVEGQIALDQGNLPLAEDRLLEAYRLLKGLHHTLEEIDVVLRLAQLANAHGERANAQRHVTELERLRLPVLRPDLVEEFTQLRRALGVPGGSGDRR
ncbi:MAG TPA: AAA family ATPase [Thermoplasmata archaeon]|jgi:tetratricopeptide (TPR) repeat protein|nr:AAA family ATPase [Thermoplasmata archaeon]HYB78809.1 AAA family ATPase [Thermoplasmata archaeon]